MDGAVKEHILDLDISVRYRTRNLGSSGGAPEVAEHGKGANGSKNRPHNAYPVRCRVFGHYEACSEGSVFVNLINTDNLRNGPLTALKVQTRNLGSSGGAPKVAEYHPPAGSEAILDGAVEEHVLDLDVPVRYRWNLFSRSAIRWAVYDTSTCRSCLDRQLALRWAVKMSSSALRWAVRVDGQSRSTFSILTSLCAIKGT